MISSIEVLHVFLEHINNFIKLFFSFLKRIPVNFFYKFYINRDNCLKEKVIYLTFDDGPSEVTESVLNVLDKHNIKATFFVTNLNPSYSFLIKDAHDRGHAIGLHSYTHNYADIYASEEAFYDDFKKIALLVKRHIGYIPSIIRFPGGSSNTVSRKYNMGIMTALSKSIQENGYQYFDWTVSSGDGASKISRNKLIKNAIKSHDDVIVLLFHDAARKTKLASALPKIIKHYRNKGYVFKIIDNDSFAPHHNIYN